MKKSITLTLEDEEMRELQRILLDGDKEAAFHFLKKYLDKEVEAVIWAKSH